MFGGKRTAAPAASAAESASSSNNAGSSSITSNNKQYVETDAFRQRRGLTAPVDGDRSGGGATSPTRSAAPRWVWTEAGFGVVVHESRAAIEQARAREIADSLAPVSPTIAAPLPVQPTAAILASDATAAPAAAASSDASSSSSSSSSSGVPDAPPLSPPPSSSPSTSLNQFLGILKSSLPTGGGAAKSANALTLPELPPVPTDQVHPSVLDDIVAVHLLPHHSRSVPAAASSPAPSAAAPSSGSSSANSASFVANPPTVVYTPSSAVHSTIRICVRTFLDLATVTPKPKSEDEAAAAASSTTAGKDPSAILKNLLGAEIRLRKEKADRERIARESGGAAAAAAVAAEADAAERDRQIEEKKRQAAAAARPKPTGPPPQEVTLEVPVNESIRGLVQRVQDFYSDYGAELDADSVRLVCNGVEFSKCVPNSVTAPVTVGAAAAAQGNPAGASASAAAASSASSAAAALDPLDPKTPLLERLGRLLSTLGGAIDSPLGSCGSGGGLGRGAVSSLENVQALVAAANQNGGKLDGAVAKMLNEAMWAQLGASPASGAAAVAAARAGAAANKGPSPLERERFYRSHTMLAECGLVPARGAPVAPAAAATAAASSSASSSSSSSSSSSTSPAIASSPPPLFNILLVYDELSRFALDTSALPAEVSLTPDALGCCMDKADNKWQTVRASAPFSAGRHMWKVRMERCAGGNLFLGVCTAAMKLNNYIGHDTNSWGYYGCGNIYRGGSSSSYGSSYRTGDVLTLQLDMDRRTLSFDKNGQPLGVAFTDLPDQVYPAFSLYTKNDCFQIIEFGSF